MRVMEHMLLEIGKMAAMGNTRIPGEGGTGKSEREDNIREIRGNICLDIVMKPNTLYTN